MLKLGGWASPDLGPQSDGHGTFTRCRNRTGSLEESSQHDGDDVQFTHKATNARRARRLPITHSSTDYARGHTRPISALGTSKARSKGDVAMTPKQACPRPQGLGHNLRSKTQWFTRFCNSHQVSHFTTFFIDARAEISIAESHLIPKHLRCIRLPAHVEGPLLLSSLFLGADRTELRSVSHQHGARK